MPLIPYITDTSDCLEEYYQVFSSMSVDYMLPATITLSGMGKSDSKQLMLRAIAKYYPDLEEKYHRLFGASDRLPEYYRNAFHRKMGELHE